MESFRTITLAVSGDGIAFLVESIASISQNTALNIDASGKDPNSYGRLSIRSGYVPKYVAAVRFPEALKRYQKLRASAT